MSMNHSYSRFIVGLLLLAFIFSSQLTDVSAVRANPNPFDTPVGKLQLVGNEWQHRLVETATGYTVVKAPASQTQKSPYFYAITGQNGDLEASEYPVSSGIDPDTISELSRSTRGRKNVTPAQRDLRRLGGYDKRPLARALASVTGGVVTIQNFVLRIRFADHIDRNLPNTAAYEKLMNGVGVSGSCNTSDESCSAPTGSVRDYFLEQSYGKVDIATTVSPWIDLPANESYYGAGCSSLCEEDVKLYGAILEAIQTIDEAGMYDWSKFDAMGGGVNGDEPDGVIDMLTLFHSGYGAEWGRDDIYGTPYDDRIWSHQYWLDSSDINAAAYTSASGHDFNQFYINPGLWDVSGSQISHIGVVVHEACHFFGLPDLYDLDSSSGSLGAFSLMADNWGFDGTQYYPSSLVAWSRIQIGFATPTLIAGTTDIDLAEVHTTPHFYKIQTGYPVGEYLLIEHRANISFDLLQPKSGVLIWKVDEAMAVPGELNMYESYPGSTGWPEQHYFIAMLEADGLYELQKSSDNYGDSGDVWTTGGVLGDLTMPTLNSYELLGCGTGVTGNLIEIKAHTQSTNSYAIGYTKAPGCNCFAGCEPGASPTMAATFAPTSSACLDSPNGWSDRNGEEYTCQWYGMDITNRCITYASVHASTADSISANEACCVCGGGYKLLSAGQPTQAPTTEAGASAITWTIGVVGVGIGGIAIGVLIGLQYSARQKVAPVK